MIWRQMQCNSLAAKCNREGGKDGGGQGGGAGGCVAEEPTWNRMRRRRSHLPVSRGV